MNHDSLLEFYLKNPAYFTHLLMAYRSRDSDAARSLRISKRYIQSLLDALCHLYSIRRRKYDDAEEWNLLMLDLQNIHIFSVDFLEKMRRSWHATDARECYSVALALTDAFAISHMTTIVLDEKEENQRNRNFRGYNTIQSYAFWVDFPLIFDAVKTAIGIISEERIEESSQLLQTYQTIVDFIVNEWRSQYELDWEYSLQLEEYRLQMDEYVEFFNFPQSAREFAMTVKTIVVETSMNHQTTESMWGRLEDLSGVMLCALSDFAIGVRPHLQDSFDELKDKLPEEISMLWQDFAGMKVFDPSDDDHEF
jgi:hypothetical protein